MSDGVDNAISFTHALTKHLLHVSEDDAQHILIAVLPRAAGLKTGWTVRVSYAGFIQEEEAPSLSEALDAMVSNLTARVSAQLEDGMKLLGKT